jgi:hypothetical protein
LALVDLVQHCILFTVASCSHDQAALAQAADPQSAASGTVHCVGGVGQQQSRRRKPRLQQEGRHSAVHLIMTRDQ